MEYTRHNIYHFVVRGFIESLVVVIDGMVHESDYNTIKRVVERGEPFTFKWDRQGIYPKNKLSSRASNVKQYRFEELMEVINNGR